MQASINAGVDVERLEGPMRTCFQHGTQNMLDHGKAVQNAFLGLLGCLTGDGKALAGCRLPEWLQEPSIQAEILGRLMHPAILARYHLYHDCGKPFCREVDENGRQHFPGHAAKSAETWRAVGGDEATGRLIAMDMDIHTISAEGMEEFANRSEAASLYLTGLAEIHANATMFGGIESTGFKSKFKHLDRRGRALIRAWNFT